MNGDKLKEKGGKRQQSKWLNFLFQLFQVNRLKDEPKLSEWSVTLVFTTTIITIVYMLVKKHNWEITSEKVSMLSLGTALPFLTFIAILILEVIGGMRKVFFEKMIEEERKAELQKAVEEARLKGIEQGKVIGANEKHKEWEEWDGKGREKSNRPKPPNSPNNPDKIRV